MGKNGLVWVQEQRAEKPEQAEGLLPVEPVNAISKQNSFNIARVVQSIELLRLLSIPITLRKLERTISVTGTLSIHPSQMLHSSSVQLLRPELL
jgi:hypothetical protein